VALGAFSWEDRQRICEADLTERRSLSETYRDLKIDSTLRHLGLLTFHAEPNSFPGSVRTIQRRFSLTVRP
jgi:hypothetical protein